MHTTPSTSPHPLCTAFSPGRLSVSWSSLSCLFFLLFVFRLQGRPPASKIQVICAMDAAELYYLNGRPFSPNSILPGRSSPVRPRLTACGRPVGLPTALTLCQQQLRSLSFHFFCSTLLRCDLHKKKVAGRTPYSQHIMIRNWT